MIMTILIAKLVEYMKLTSHFISYKDIIFNGLYASSLSETDIILLSVVKDNQAELRLLHCLQTVVGFWKKPASIVKHMCLWSVCVSGHCHQDTFKVMPPDQLAWLAQSVISPSPPCHCSDKYLNIIPHYCVAHCSPSLISQPFRFHFMDNDARRLAQLQGEITQLKNTQPFSCFPVLYCIYLTQLPNKVLIDHSILTVSV